MKTRVASILAACGLLGGAAVLAASCKDLGDFTLGVCGNSVLEAGEDCEPTDKTSNPESAFCAPKGDVDECRYVCRPISGDPTKRGACPANEACGVDGVCRAAGTTFTLGGQPVSANAQTLHVADFDGDGRSDVLVSKGDNTVDMYFATGRDLGAPTALPADAREGIAVGFLNHDTQASAQGSTRELADFVVGSGAALGPLLGDAQRQINVAAVPSYLFGNATRILAGPSKGVAQTGTPLKPDTDVEGVALGFPSSPSFSLVLKGPSGELAQLNGPDGGVFGVSPLDLSPQISHAPLVKNRESSCDEIVITAPDAHKVFVVYPCSKDAQNHDIPNPNTASDPAPVVIVPASMQKKLSGPAIVADVVDLATMSFGKDGNLDVVLPAEGGVFVAPGSGTPVYPGLVGNQVTAVDLCGLPGSGAFCQIATGEGILALDDFNGDGVEDVVTHDDVELSDPTGYYQAAFPSLHPWGEAIVADLNGDGRPDVAAAPADLRKGLEVLLASDGSYFNPTVLPSKEHVGLLSSGDYDGDGVADVVARVADPDRSCVVPDDIVAFFGRKSAGVEDGRVVGRLLGVEQIISGRLPRLDRTDSISDFGVTSFCSSDPTYRVSVFYGTMNRLLDAPFIVTDQLGDPNSPQIAPYDPVALALPSGSLGTAPGTEVAIGMLATYAASLDPVPAHQDAQLFIQVSDSTKLFSQGHVVSLSTATVPYTAALARRSTVAVANLDADVAAEVAVWVPSADGEASSHLVIVDDYACVPDSTTGGPPGGCMNMVVPATLRSIDLPAIGASDVQRADLFAADLDGDGLDDLVLDVVAGGVGRLFFIPNGTQGVGSPTEIAGLSAASAAITSPDPAVPTSSAPVLLVAGSGAAGSGVYEISFQKSGDRKAKLVPGVSFSGDVTGRIATGDVDGDGLGDIVLLDGGSVRAYFRDTELAGTAAAQAAKGGAK